MVSHTDLGMFVSFPGDVTEDGPESDDEEEDDDDEVRKGLQNDTKDLALCGTFCTLHLTHIIDAHSRRGGSEKRERKKE